MIFQLISCRVWFSTDFALRSESNRAVASDPQLILAIHPFRWLNAHEERWGCIFVTRITASSFLSFISFKLQLSSNNRSSVRDERPSFVPLNMNEKTFKSPKWTNIRLKKVKLKKKLKCVWPPKIVSSLSQANFLLKKLRENRVSLQFLIRKRGKNLFLDILQNFVSRLKVLLSPKS